MDDRILNFLLLVLVILGIFFLILYIVRNKSKIHSDIDFNNIIQRKTSTFYFNINGILESATTNTSGKGILNQLQKGHHISELTDFKNIVSYFESCIKHKKNISIKLFEDSDSETSRRHDLIFSPMVENETVTGVVIMDQELDFSDTEKTISKQKELVEQRNFALKQIDEIEAQKSELELAFKKSSKHHIMLQKALRQIEAQRNELETALSTINEQKLELEKANQEIRESSRMKEIFLANTSHEIRTPLNAIIGFTNLLLNGNLETGQRKYIENIKASGNNLLVVINDILDFSKIESGKLTLEQIEFDFRNLIKHTINTLQVKSQERQIELKYDISSEIPEIIIGDPVRLNQILINLIGNAIKFTNMGGNVKLLATTGKAEEGFVKILFKVEDNGIGIPREKLNQIFQSFTQGESDTTRKYGGTGLGLSIVKQLIELQNGEITVESAVGKGTAFTFYIILRPGNKLGTNHIKHQSKEIESSMADNMRILLVEDNIINQQLAFDTLKSWNNKIEIELANNGKIALDKVSHNHFDLVLMDIQMPEMDGIEATISIRKLPSPKNETPIMAMTAHALKNEKENCLKIGMNDYISKPFDPEELFVKILNFVPTNKRITSLPNEESKPIIEFKQNFVSEPQHNTHYTYFHIENLRKIYHDSHDKIIKIVGMCYNSIPTEIMEIQEAYDNQEWDVLRNKAHSLKPKLGYLGMDEMQNKAKDIEIASQQAEKRSEIQKLITEISGHWNLAIPELKQFINT